MKRDTKVKTVTIPITPKNRQGIDDLMDAIRELFAGEFEWSLQEAYIIETDNPGLIAFAQAMADRAGGALSADLPHVPKPGAGRPRKVKVQPEPE